MDLAELRTEFQARGFDYITPDSRVDRFLNDAYHQLCDRYAWPFLETTITGVAPLLITDLRAVLSVTDITTEARLWGADLRDILASDPSLSATGEPDFWYLDGQVTVGVYPANTSDTLSVRYLSSPVDLSGDGDEPVVPDRFQWLIVENAVFRAYRDSDNFEAAAQVKGTYEDGVLEMVAALMARNYSTPPTVVRTGLIGDYGA